MAPTTLSQTLGAEWEEYLALRNQRPELFEQSDDLEIIFDEQVVSRYQEQNNRTIGVLYRSPFNTLVVDLVRDAQGRTFAYERFIQTSTGMGIVGIPIYNGSFLLLRQYRHAMRGYQYAFPRGYGEDGLSAEEDAAKEFSEELGATLNSTTLLGYVIANSGISGDRVAVFSCDVKAYETQEGHEEITNTVLLTREELDSWIAEGRINDGFTLSALALLDHQPRINR